MTEQREDESHILRGVTPELFEPRLPALHRLETSGVSTPGYAYALDGTAEYRGWYHIASGPEKGKSRWCPKQSKFDGPRAGGKHQGADLYSHGRETLIAVTAGNIEYRPPQPAGWGNHIYLYFKSGGTTLIAVYAHIDASSAFTGIKAVKKGDKIGRAGCSGNAGDDGKCWRQYKCGEKIAAEDHLHFELIEPGTPIKRHDPVAFFGWSVLYEHDETCAVCAVTHQLIDP